ncbi:MAG: hypothetical protein JW746_09205 [Candidatus Krumholzibacteriota bacterium]|nr:hypothetical protein [Candidatus Krumholzibacteriota bacterium]
MKKVWPFRGTAGIILIAVFWPLNWLLPGSRTAWGFFPLWFGYCLFVDSLVFYRKGSSMVSRSLRGYILLFVISAPSWWLFELLNLRSGNWSYQGRELFSNIQYALFASMSFSTVMPAVFGTAELAGTFKWICRMSGEKGQQKGMDLLLPAFITGCISLFCFLAWPRYFFPLLWVSLFLIIDPVNGWRGRRSLIDDIGKGKWRVVVSLGLGSLICGFFWEMWNFYSYPKWVYHVPLVDLLRVFEMPLPGYGGYLPFALELMAIYFFLTGIFRAGKDERFIQI